MVPATAPVSTIGVIAVLVQMVCDDGVATAFGVGFTSTLAVTGVPLQPLAVGVMVNTVVCGVLVLLVSVPLIVPLPLAAMPVRFTVLSLVQLKTVPTTVGVRVIGAIAAPEQIVCGASGLQPLMPGTVRVPTLVQDVPLPVALIQPDATTTPLHLTSHRQALSLNAPCASMKKVNGAFTDGVVADGVGGGLNPYGPPLSTTAPSELVNVHVISSAKLPLPVMITCTVGVTTPGVGFTITVAVVVGPVQPFADGVMVNVTV